MQTADYPSHSTFQAYLKKYTPQACTILSVVRMIP